MRFASTHTFLFPGILNYTSTTEVPKFDIESMTIAIGGKIGLLNGTYDLTHAVFVAPAAAAIGACGGTLGTAKITKTVNTLNSWDLDFTVTQAVAARDAYVVLEFPTDFVSIGTSTTAGVTGGGRFVHYSKLAVAPCN
jgi:hypothetical protein